MKVAVKFQVWRYI